MTLDELVNDVKMAINFSGSMPDILPDIEIIRIIENEAKSWFHENYDNAAIKEYLFIPAESFKTDHFTKYKTVQLPCDCQRLVWLYQVNSSSLFSLGVNAPNLSMNLGVSNQPYLSSTVSTIGELAVYKVVIDSFADQLNQLQKYTLKFDFNRASKQLNILTSTGMNAYNNTPTSVVAEVYTTIPDEDLYELDHFRRYIKAKCNIQLGRLLTRFDYTMPGNIKISSAAILAEGKEDLTTLMEEIKATRPTNAIIRMIKR